MAGMTTVLTEFSNTGNSRTSTYTGHTAAEPKLVIEKRRVPEGNQTMIEYSFKVVEAGDDSNGEVCQQKVSLECVARYPIDMISTDVDAAVTIFRDIVAGDEFANSISTQEWL